LFRDFGELSSLLTTQQSTVVPQQDQHDGTLFPQIAETYVRTVDVLCHAIRELFFRRIHANPLTKCDRVPRY